MTKKTVADLDREEQELRSRLASISKERDLAIQEQSLEALDTQAKLSEAIHQNRYLIAALAGHPSTVVHDEHECGICRLLNTETWQLPSQTASDRDYAERNSYGVDFFLSVAAYERNSTRYLVDGTESPHKEVVTDYVALSKPRLGLTKKDGSWIMTGIHADYVAEKPDKPAKRKSLPRTRSRKVSA